MQNPPGYLTASKSRQFECENCSLLFDSQKALQNHQAKFCSNPKYNQLELLQKQFQQKSKGRDISLYGKPSLINFNNNPKLPKDISNLNQNSQLLGIQSVLNNNNSILLDKEYQSVLDELTNKQSLKKQLQREKNQAYQELEMLDKRENDVLIDLKQDELSGVLKRRKQLEDEQKRIQKQMHEYEAKRKEMQKQIQMVDKQDYIFKEARYAGKLAKQREILEEKKLEMERNLKQKRKEKAEIQHRLNESKLTQQQVYVPPNFRKQKEQPKNSNRKVMAASNPSLKTPEDSLDSLSFQNTNRANSGFNNQFVNQNQPFAPPSYQQQNVGIQHWPPEPPIPQQSLQNSPSYQSPLQRSTTEIFNLPQQKHSQPLKNTKPQPGDDTFPYFTPEKFSKNQKLLTDMLNKNGKSEEDAFIEMLNAQQYDSLNLLAKIPKQSELYQVKLKQYQQISKLRDEYKREAHQKRIDKMKREFEYEKKIMEKEMQNAVWVDENRKMMLAQQINIVKNQEQWERDKELLNRQALMQKQQQFMTGTQNPNQSQIPQNVNPYQSQSPNPNPYASQNQNPYQAQNPNQNSGQNDPYSIRTQTPQKPLIKSTTSLANGNQPQSNPYDSYLNKLQQSYSAQQPNNPRTSITYPLDPQFLNTNPVTTSNPNFNPMTQNTTNNPSPFSNQQRYSTLNLQPNQQHQPNSQDFMWGYKITVQMMKGYRRSKPVKIKLIIKQHDITTPNAQMSSLKYQYSTTYHYQKIAQQLASNNPNMNNKFDSNKNVIYKQEFTIPLNLQEYFNTKQNDVYLWIFALQKDEAKLTNEPVIYAWYNLKLTHFGQVKEGKFTLNLYGDQSTFPNPSDMNKKKNKLQEEIVVELNEVLVQKEKPPMILPNTQQAPYQPPEVVQIGSNKSNKIPSQQSLVQPTQQTITANTNTQFSNTNSNTNPIRSGQTNSSINKNSVPQIQQPNSQTSIVNQFNNTKQSKNSASLNDQPFIPLEFDPQFLNTTNKQPKNIDITLAQLRTLPSYTGPVKIQLTFIDSEGIQVLPRQEVLTDLTSGDMYNPFVNFVKKIRKQKLITPTTMLFIRFLALNALDYEIYMLGFTVFYLFFNQNGQPCPTNDTKQFLMSTGYFQLPIFWGSCAPFYSSIQQIIQRYPLIPCTSILIGCHANTTDTPNRIPKYGQKVYNTTLFHAQQNQIRLFEEQYKRQHLDSSKIMKGYLQFKGFNINYSQQQAHNYFFKAMGFTNDNTTNLFPLDYMAQYQQFFGIYFSVDKLIIPDNKQNYYYFMTLCMTPPGKYYTSKGKDNDDLKIVWAVEPDNSKRCELAFAGNEFGFQPRYDINTCVVIQFKRIKIGKENEIGPDIENYAFVIVPLFKQIEQVRCVNVSQDTVNTYPGAFNPKDVGEMKKDLASYLDKLGQSAQPSEIEFSFRVMNGYFTTQFIQDKPETAGNRKTSYFSWYSRPIDFEDANKKVKALIERKYDVKL